MNNFNQLKRERFFISFVTMFMYSSPYLNSQEMLDQLAQRAMKNYPGHIFGKTGSPEIMEMKKCKIYF